MAEFSASPAAPRAMTDQAKQGPKRGCRSSRSGPVSPAPDTHARTGPDLGWQDQFQADGSCAPGDLSSAEQSPDPFARFATGLRSSSTPMSVEYEPLCSRLARPSVRALRTPTSGSAGAPRRNGLSLESPSSQPGKLGAACRQFRFGRLTAKLEISPEPSPRLQVASLGSEPRRGPTEPRTRASPQPETPRRKKSDLLLGRLETRLDEQAGWQLHQPAAGIGAASQGLPAAGGERRSTRMATVSACRILTP